MNFKELADAEKNLKKHHEKYVKEMKEGLTEIFKGFFQYQPTVQAVVWEQYTPYFNDGEECVFRVGDPVYVTKNFDPKNRENSSYEYEDDELYESVNEYEKSELSKACSAFSKLLHRNDEILKELYGNHVTVFLTPEEVFVTDYDHD